jgi:hypothetical protein
LRTWVASLCLLVVVILVNGVVSLPQRLLVLARGGGSWYALDNYRYPPSGATILTIAGQYSSAGRSIVAIDHLTFDVALPFAYASFLAISIALLARTLFGPGPRAQLLAVVPVVGGLFDLLENTGIVVVCLGYNQDWTIPVAWVIGWLTIGKFAGLLVSLLVGSGFAVMWSGRAIYRLPKAPA